MKDGFFTTYYAFNWIVLDVLMKKFNIQVDEDTVTQLTLLHNDIPGYDLPAMVFVSPSEEAQESHILKDTKIFTHLEKVLVHMTDKQDTSSVFKICRNMAIHISYLLICSFLCDILLIVTFTPRQCRLCL